MIEGEDYSLWFNEYPDNPLAAQLLVHKLEKDEMIDGDRYKIVINRVAYVLATTTKPVNMQVTCMLHNR